MDLNKFLILEYLNENNQYLKAYRGIGNNINATYGGISDDGMGEFWTSSKVMAEWFAGISEYNGDTDKYELTDNPNPGKVLEKNISFKNPYIIDSAHEEYDEDYDSVQIYFNEIKTNGGVAKYKKLLKSQGYDGIILDDCNTNYYEDGTYSIYIIF